MLVVAPWSVFWERNLVVEMVPAVRAVAEWPAVRGAVSGVGLVNLGAGGAELAVAFGAVVSRWRSNRRARGTRPDPDVADPPSRDDSWPWTSE